MLDTTTRLIRLPEVRRLTGLSRSALYELAAQGKLAPIKITRRASAWLESEVSEFIAERIRASREGQAARTCAAPTKESGA